MDWNERYALGDIPWEKGAAAPPLEEISARLGDAIWGEGPVLVPGCGFGHDARWIAQKGVAVLGLDVSELALRGAREQTDGDNSSFEQGDFFEVEAESYSALFEHTCFCAISPSDRSRYVTSAVRSLKKGAHLVAIFFLNPDHEGGPPFGCTPEELNRLFGEDFELIDEWEPQASYPGREGRERVRIYRKKEIVSEPEREVD